MARSEARRASRHHVKWPARLRAIASTKWQPAQVLNLSVTGALLRIEQSYEIGERVEVEIHFLTHPEYKTIVTGIGRVVREDCHVQAAAIHFDLGCTPTLRAIAPDERDARP